MRIILTHEQADFDALASLLAGYLLDERVLPVLPHRMNRNVRAFVTIYGAELPFVEQRDLPAEPVESICLVDTQSMITLKGITADTQVQIVDHHPNRGNLPSHWNLTCDLTGATTTLLVEGIQEENGRLCVVNATLLLLGIYEDTGSLTYSRTTARDLKAAAFLLENGASLRIAADFLNHPLSAAQQRLYDQLRSDARMKKIHGHNVILATGSAQEMDEELSTIVHKLRDLLDPDAVFVLVTTKSGVQLIARSNNDQIDVSEIAARFGGGGHDRAAAALVRDRQMGEVLVELETILPEIVHPAITVAQIMSRGPQVLAPDTSAVDAAQRMQRYGYEGYPVVKDGKILGLLTRRAVDRAISHKLNLVASSLMNAGEVSVSPGDSIETLQRLMVDSGWGQIPVVHPESGEVIGIVTRTDLLKTLTNPLSPSYRNIADRLASVLPPAHLALLKTVAQEAHEKHLAIYIVGGFVRDLLLDHPSLDFDFVVEGDAIDLAQSLFEKFGGRVTTHHRFGTAKWYIGAGLAINDRGLIEKEATRTKIPIDLPPFLDFITARTEFYTYPTALPTVETGSIKLDLHRRDFTINTLALRLDGYHYGDLHDYWGGLNDLREGLVRVLHSLSFVDDPTRMLRAVRFEQRFGFKIEERTCQLLREASSLLTRISGDRIRHELDHILDEEKNTVEMLGRLQELGLLYKIHPELLWDEWLRRRFSTLPVELPGKEWGFFETDIHPQASWKNQRRLLAYALWLIRLPANQIQAVSLRIKIPRNQIGDILAASKLYLDLPGLAPLPPSAVVSRLEDVPLFSIYAACMAASDFEPCELLSTYLTQWRKIQPTINGEDLKRLGLPPGPVYKKVLRLLRDAWLDGSISTVEQEKILLDKLLSQENQAIKPKID